MLLERAAHVSLAGILPSALEHTGHCFASGVAHSGSRNSCFGAVGRADGCILCQDEEG